MSRTTSVETPYGWLVVAASVLLITIGNGATYIPIVALKAIASDFEWPRAIPALGYSLVMLGAGLGGVFAGRWSDRSGMAPPLTVGIVMIGLGCVLTSYAGNVVTFLCAQGLFIGLLGNAALYGPLVANITRWFDVRRGLAVGVVATGQAMAGAIWSPVFRVAVDTVGWRDTFFYYGLFLAITLLPLVLVFRRRAPAPEVTGAAALAEGQTAISASSRTVMIWLCVAIIGCCVAMSMPLVHLVSHVSDLGFGLGNGAAVLSVALAGAFVSRLTWGAVSDRIGGIATLLLTSAWQALALLGLALVDGLTAIFLVAAFFGLGYGGIVPAYAVIVREVFDASHVGRRLGVVVMFGTIGMAMGSWLAGAIYDVAGSYSPAFFVGYLFNLLNLAIVSFLLGRWRHRGATVRYA